MKAGILLKDTRVNLTKGTGVTVSDQEAWRLTILGAFKENTEDATRATKTALEAQNTKDKSTSKAKKK